MENSKTNQTTTATLTTTASSLLIEVNIISQTQSVPLYMQSKVPSHSVTHNDNSYQ